VAFDLVWGEKRLSSTAERRVGIIGCGTIGSRLCRSLDRGEIAARLSMVCDIDRGKVERILEMVKEKPRVATIGEICEQCDVVVEAAQPDAVPEVLKAALKARPVVLVMSVGGLLMDPSVYRAALDAGVEVHFPAGAIVGLDGLRAAAEGRLSRVLLRTTKPPRGLEGAPYVKERGIDLRGIEQATTIFRGSAQEAIVAFPRNINVAAAVSLTALGPERVEVEIVADPGCERNMHELFVEGEFGSLYTRTENIPSPENPKTSYLASLSAIELVKRLAAK